MKSRCLLFFFSLSLSAPLPSLCEVSDCVCALGVVFDRRSCRSRPSLSSRCVEPCGRHATPTGAERADVAAPPADTHPSPTIIAAARWKLARYVVAALDCRDVSGRRQSEAKRRDQTATPSESPPAALRCSDRVGRLVKSSRRCGTNEVERSKDGDSSVLPPFAHCMFVLIALENTALNLPRRRYRSSSLLHPISQPVGRHVVPAAASLPGVGISERRVPAATTTVAVVNAAATDAVTCKRK